MLGVVLADILESNYRRALIMATPKGGIWNYFLTRPVSMIIVAIIILFALVPVFKKVLFKGETAS